MARTNITEEIELPEGVSITINGDQITAKGPKGESTKKMQARGVIIKADNGKVTLTAQDATKLQKNMLFTYKAHIKNLAKGAAEGYNYKLKICSGHFPMNVGLKGNTLEVKNYIGEKVPRILKIKEGAEVKINGDEIEVNSVNKETAGQVAADIEKLMKRPGFDRRIFQDGIYITEKDGKAM